MELLLVTTIENYFTKLLLLFLILMISAFIAYLFGRYLFSTFLPFDSISKKTNSNFIFIRFSIILCVTLVPCVAWFFYLDDLFEVSQYLEAFIIALLGSMFISIVIHLAYFMNKYSNLVLIPQKRKSYLDSLNNQILYYDKKKSIYKYIFLIIIPIFIIYSAQYLETMATVIDVVIEKRGLYFTGLYYCIILYFLFIQIRISAKLYLKPESLLVESYFGKQEFVDYHDILEMYTNKYTLKNEIMLLLNNSKIIRLDRDIKQLGDILEDLLPRLTNLQKLDIEYYLTAELWQKPPDWALIEKVRKRVEKNKAIWENPTN